MTKIPASSKLSEASDTSWLNKIRADIFFRTETIIIGTLFFLCFVNVAIIAIAFNRLHIDIAAVVISSLSESIASGSFGAPSSLSTSEAMFVRLSEIRNIYLVIIAAISVIVTILFGYIVARIALSPARNALAAQKQFIANIAHELRTPLSIIKANSEIMLMEARHDSHTTATIKSNVEELDRISGIINNLLTLNTFRHAQHMNFEWITLRDAAHNAVQKLEYLAKSKQVSLVSDLSDTFLIWANKSALDQIAMNLVKNAIIYTPSGGSVEVRTADDDKDRTILKVIDNGIGIEQEKLGRIFEPFYRVDSSRSKSVGGSGLGLAIVSELVKFHHGRISIQSVLNKGTTVTVEFPSKTKDESLQKLSPASTADTGIVVDFSRRK